MHHWRCRHRQHKRSHSRITSDISFESPTRSHPIPWTGNNGVNIASRPTPRQQPGWAGSAGIIIIIIIIANNISAASPRVRRPGCCRVGRGALRVLTIVKITSHRVRGLNRDLPIAIVSIVSIVVVIVVINAL